MVEGESFWEVIKLIGNWVVIPLMGGVMWFAKKHINRLDIIEKDVQQLEVRSAVLESQITTVAKNIEEIKSDVKRLIERK